MQVRGWFAPAHFDPDEVGEFPPFTYPANDTGYVLKMPLVEGKIVTVGAEGVGKTSLIMRQVGNVFPRNVSPTIGASFFTFSMYLKETRLKIQLWDTAGQERFRSMAPLYYRKANAALVLYDITSQRSFEEAKGWVEELKEKTEDYLFLLLIGNKLDLGSQREVSEEDAVTYADSIGAKHLQCSAATGQGLKDIFLQAATGLLELHQRDVLLKSQQGMTASEISSPLATPPTIPVAKGADTPRQPRQTERGQSCSC